MRTKSRLAGFIIFFQALVFLFCSGHHAALGEPGKVIPLSESPKVKKGVHPFFSDTPAGRAQPLPWEDSDTRQIIAEGWATIYHGDVERARLAALRMAYAEAVGRTCGLEIESLMLVRNVKQVSDVVMSRSKGFIRNYKIFYEGVSSKDPTRYEVQIEAEVVEKGVAQGEEREGLRLYLELLGNPRLLIMLPEKRFSLNSAPTGSSQSQAKIEIQDKDTKICIERSEKKQSVEKPSGERNLTKDDQGTVFGSAEAALAQAFSKYGYQVVTSDDLLARGLIDPEVLRQAKSGVTAQAVKVAQAAETDIALLGVMRLSQNSIKPAGVSLVMITAEASAKALIVSSARMVHAFHHSERASARNELTAYADCLDRVANGIADVLAWKIPHILTQEGRETKLIVHDIDISMAHKIRKALVEAPGVEAVRFSKLPTTIDLFAEFIVLTGFVRVAQEEILEICTESTGRSMTLLRANKYEIEMELDEILPVLPEEPELKRKGV